MPSAKPEIADAVDDERLDRRGAGARPVVPVADQQIAREADALPAEEQLQQIVAGHQHQHGEAEQAEIAEKPPASRVMAHVADAVDVDQRRHAGDHRHHDGGELVVAQRPVDVEAAGVEPGAERDHAGRAALVDAAKVDKLHEGGHAAGGGQQHAEDGDRHGGTVADGLAEQPGDGGAEQRREDGDGEQHRLSPSSGSRPRPGSSRGCGNRSPRWPARSPPRRRRRSG